MAKKRARNRSRMPASVPNKAQLYSRVGVDRKTLDNHLGRPDCPQAKSDGRYVVAEFEEYFRKKKGTPEADTSLLDEKKREEIRKLKLENDESEHSLEQKVLSQAQEVIQEFVDRVKPVVDAMPQAVATRCNAAEPAIAEKVLREWLEGKLYPVMRGRSKQ
jgi:hypothetical protein